jgi:hypothetical protein
LARLKEEIRALIALHRPRDVDTASALALLQEDELALTKIKPVGRGFTKGFDRAALHKTAEKTPQSDSEDKLASLKQFRRKNGLCFKCGGKWAPNHTCPDQVPIHVLEELWEAIQSRDEEDPDEIPSEIQSAEDTILAVQSPTSETKGRRQTLKLLAHIGKQQVLVLVDSGSIGTFVSDKLVQTLKLPVVPCPLATFRAAEGDDFSVHNGCQNCSGGCRVSLSGPMPKS